jgi:hypothetical protein
MIEGIARQNNHAVQIGGFICHNGVIDCFFGTDL